jgi:hypothetical protein
MGTAASRIIGARLSTKLRLLLRLASALKGEWLGGWW